MASKPSRARISAKGTTVLAAFAVGCASSAPVAPMNASAALRSSSIENIGVPPVAARPTPSSEDDAEHVVAAALAQTSRIRELASLGPVRGVTLSRKEMAAQVKRAVEREVPPEVVAAEGEVLVALGVVPVSFDYVGALVSLMSAELAGYYEPAEKTMYLASDLHADDRAATLSHELVHALQDQHYGLAKLLDYRPDDSDAQAAVHALAEGDATSAMLDQILLPRGAKATDLSEELLGVQVRAAAQFSSDTASVPNILKRSLVAPYVDGIDLVHFLRRRGGWAEVDRVWNAPPLSTEQLLHPEKLLAREAPIIIPVPPAPAGGTSDAVLTDVLGEQSLRLLLEEWLPRASAEAAASDWGGDRLAVFHAAEEIAVAIHIRADSVRAATRLTSGLSRGVAAQGTVVSGSGSVCADRPDRGPLLAARRGRDVVVVAGPYRRASGASVTSAATCSAAAAWAARILARP